MCGVSLKEIRQKVEIYTANIRTEPATIKEKRHRNYANLKKRKHLD
jgi:hypothetical protein